MKSKEKSLKYSSMSLDCIQADLENAAKANEIAFNDMQLICDEYNKALDDGHSLIEDVAGLINSIANHPKKFDDQIEKIKAIKIEYLTLEQYKTKERIALIEGGLLASAFAAVGGVFAAFGRSKKRGLIGCCFALIGLLFGWLLTWCNKRKAKKQAIDAVKKLMSDTAYLQQNRARVQSTLQQIAPTASNLQLLLTQCEKYRGVDKIGIRPLSESRKQLSLLVTNTASFAKLLSQKV